MKITGLKTFVLGSGWRNLILLRLETDQPGLYGIGEGTVQWGDEGMVGYPASLRNRATQRCLSISHRSRNDICWARIRATSSRCGSAFTEMNTGGETSLF